jgi:hypothetical protein
MFRLDKQKSEQYVGKHANGDEVFDGPLILEATYRKEDYEYE